MQLIMEVTDVRIAILESNPAKVNVWASGQVSTSGWTNPSLGPWFYVSPPSDGIQDFDFLADPPTGIVLEVITPIAAQLRIDLDPENYWGEGKTLKGVRIHARSNKKEAAVEIRREMLAAGGDTNPWPWRNIHQSRNQPSLDDAVASLVGRRVRVIRPGDPITMDLIPGRVNIDVDMSNVISRIWFG